MSYGETPAAQQEPRPRAVDVGAGLVALVGLVNAGRVAYGVFFNLRQDDWDSGARTVFLALNAGVLAFALFTLLLAYQVWRGRQWGWIVSLVLLPIMLLFGGLLLLITVLNGDVPLAGIGVVAASLGALITLAAPRAVRDYFLRKPVPAVPYPGPVPAQSPNP
jgi:hypothetical protein